ncbi:MAG: hypothetical protein P1Q69_03810 [Candidatus Thorarchaeota archaeon]|nr:hypothetical protein [Candidatus Thorarchaeota archaeon]
MDNINSMRAFYNVLTHVNLSQKLVIMMEVLRNVFQRMFGRWAKSPNDQQYYVKILFAIMSGIACAAGGQAFAGIRGLMLGLLIYALSLYVVVYLLEIDPEDLGGRQKLITGTLPSYLLLWVLLWTILYAFTLPASILEGLVKVFTAGFL